MPGGTSVIIDSADGMDQAVDHLAALGHRTIAYLNGPRRSWSNAQRQKAIKLACRRHSITMIEFGPFEPQIQSGVHAADLLLASEATGVIAYDDLIALGVIARLTERGVRTGQDISVIGVDDSPMSAMAYPTLTTVHVPGAEAGIAAVDALIALIDGADPGEVVRLETRLVIRSSTGPPPPDLEPQLLSILRQVRPRCVRRPRRGRGRGSRAGCGAGSSPGRRWRSGR